MAEYGRLVLGNEATVVALVESEITERKLLPGSKLPTERELAERSGQSRAAVRRAMQVLESEGRVVRHVGRGTFLTANGSTGEDGVASSVSPADIMSLRMIMEPQAMPMVVKSGTTSDFDEMRRCLEAGEAAEDYAGFETWDAALHRAIVSAAHNPLLDRVMDMLNDARQDPLWGRLKHLSHTPERRCEYETDHREIVAALVERDSAAAQQAMRAHLVRVRGYLLGED